MPVIPQRPPISSNCLSLRFRLTCFPFLFRGCLDSASRGPRVREGTARWVIGAKLLTLLSRLSAVVIVATSVAIAILRQQPEIHSNVCRHGTIVPTRGGRQIFATRTARHAAIATIVFVVGDGLTPVVVGAYEFASFERFLAAIHIITARADQVFPYRSERDVNSRLSEPIVCNNVVACRVALGLFLGNTVPQSFVDPLHDLGASRAFWLLGERS